MELQRLYGAGAIKVLKRPGKMGLGSAYIDGLKLATGDFIFIMDADLSHHVRGWLWEPCVRACPFLDVPVYSWGRCW